MQKRVLSIVMVLVLLLGLTSCKNSDSTGANTDSPTTGTTNAEIATEKDASLDDASGTVIESTTDATTDSVVDELTKLSADGLGGYKIGFWFTPATDPMSKGFRDVLDTCAKLTNCEMVYYDMTDWSAGAQATAVESLVSLGCDAIIMITGNSPGIFQYMNDNKVYYAGMTRSYSDEVALVTDNSEYCTGWTGDLGGKEGANFKSGYDMTQVLADQGCKNIAFFESSEGERMGDERTMGIEACAEDTGMNIVASYRGYDWATGLADVLASFGSQLDGIVFPGGSGEMAIAAIQTAGYLDKIKLVQGNSAGDNTREYLEQGILVATGTSGQSFIVQMYMQLFNALSGADRLFDTGNKIYPSIPGLIVRNAEEWDTSLTLSMDLPLGLPPYDILKLNSLIAPGMTVEEREALITYYCSDAYMNVENLRAEADKYLNSLK